MLSRDQAISASASSSAPGFCTMKAFTTSPFSASGCAIDRGLRHGRVLDEDGLDLFGEHAVARDLDHFLEAADEGEVAVGVDLAHVAGVHPAVAQRGGGGLGLVPVALEGAGAGRARSRRPRRWACRCAGVGVDDADGHARHRRCPACPSAARGAACRCRRCGFRSGRRRPRRSCSSSRSRCHCCASASVKVMPKLVTGFMRRLDRSKLAMSGTCMHGHVHRRDAVPPGHLVARRSPAARRAGRSGAAAPRWRR